MFPVRYDCPRCEIVVTLQREGYLAGRSVTPYPLEGRDSAGVGGDYVGADSVPIVSGTDEKRDKDRDDEPVATFGTEGCGELFYLSFVRFEDGGEVEIAPESRRVELTPDAPTWPRGPSWPGR